MMKKILVIGKNSLLAKNFLLHIDRNKSFEINSCRHKNIPSEINSYDFVVNFSFNPKLYTNEYIEKYDQDLKIAKLIRNSKKTKMVIFSSRQVYGVHNDLYTFKEDDVDLNRTMTTYGLNKVQCENNVKKCINDNSRLLICRSANIFSQKVGGKNFTGIALNSLLKNDLIMLNSSRRVVKDFLPVDLHSIIIQRLVIDNDTA